MTIATGITRLTIKLPESQRRQTKAVAALRGETVSDIVREALEAYVAEMLEESEDVRRVREIETRVASGQERLYSHEQVWKEIEVLEAQGALPG